jgi:predicted RNA-binding Zn ribbon-like protein
MEVTLVIRVNQRLVTRALDVRHFTHHGVAHEHGDELTGTAELGAWMAQRRLSPGSAKVMPAMFEAALQLRAGVRAYLACDPAQRRTSRDAIRSLNAALAPFPLVARALPDRGMVLGAARDDALAGLAAISAELYLGSIRGTLDRLKMCASEQCRRVFFDRSKPATRRWCMSTLCGNRIKTRAYRARQRDAGN